MQTRCHGLCQKQLEAGVLDPRKTNKQDTTEFKILGGTARGWIAGEQAASGGWPEGRAEGRQERPLGRPRWDPFRGPAVKVKTLQEPGKRSPGEDG